MLHLVVAPVLMVGAFLILGSIGGFLGWLKGGLLGTVLIAIGVLLLVGTTCLPSC